MDRIHIVKGGDILLRTADELMKDLDCLPDAIHSLRAMLLDLNDEEEVEADIHLDRERAIIRAMQAIEGLGRLRRAIGAYNREAIETMHCRSRDKIREALGDEE